MKLIYSNSRDVLPIRRRYASALVAAWIHEQVKRGVLDETRAWRSRERRGLIGMLSSFSKRILGKSYSEGWISDVVGRHECGSTDGLVAAAAAAMNRMAQESPKHARPAEERQKALAEMFQKNGMPVPAWVQQA